jgi:hypothetical protein
VLSRLIDDALYRAEVDERDAADPEEVRAIELELERMAAAFRHTQSYAVTFYDEQGKAVLQDSFTYNGKESRQEFPIAAVGNVLSVSREEAERLGIRTHSIAVVSDAIKKQDALAQKRAQRKSRPKMRTITSTRKVRA